MEGGYLGRILVVDDDEGVARLAARALEREGFELATCHSGADAVAYLERNDVELVVLDFLLPDATANELVSRLDEIQRLPPFLVISGHADASLAVQMLGMGARDCIVKNAGLLDVLPGAVRRALAAVEQDRRLREIEADRDQRVKDLERATETLERQNAELEEFAFIAAHDLQEPLRTISSYCELLRNDAAESLSDEAETDLRFIIDAAGRMREMVTDILVLSKTAHGQLKHESVPLDDCVDETLSALDAKLKEAGAEVRRETLPTVKADRRLLTQVFHNLIGNATKFVEERSPVITIAVEERGEEWVVGVEDNGIGIEAKYARQIFSPFQRLHSNEEYSGSGIGLTICRKAVERLGGRIWVESEPGLGSQFKFTLARNGDNL